MRRRGFCFPSPTTQREHDGDFADFIAAHDIYNPWPELVPSDDPSALRQAACQPLLRMRYVPTTDVAQLTLMTGNTTTNSLPLLLAQWHETYHLLLDFTPAKEWARVCLAYAHADCEILLGTATHAAEADEDSPLLRQQASDAWQEVARMNAILEATARRIMLAEELLVSSLAVERVLDLHRDSINREEFERWVSGVLDEQAVAVYAAIDGGHADFARFHHEFRRLNAGFRRLARLILDDRDKAAKLSRLAIYLEPLEFLDPQPDTLEASTGETENDISIFYLVQPADSLPRCVRLIDFVERSESANLDDVLAWIEVDIQRTSDERWARASERVRANFTDLDEWIDPGLPPERQAWQYALAMALLFYEPGTGTMRALWQLGSVRAIISAELLKLPTNEATKAIQDWYLQSADWWMPPESSALFYPNRAVPYRTGWWFVNFLLIPKRGSFEEEITRLLKSSGISPDDDFHRELSIFIDHLKNSTTPSFAEITLMLEHLDEHPAISLEALEELVENLQRKGEGFALTGEPFVFESIRQQLNTGLGFRCPLVDQQSGHCVCGDTIVGFKEELRQLVRWAQSGMFGPGEWSDPPCSCAEPA
jgi:hypothetical protein